MPACFCECRSRPTRIIGKKFYIYAARTPAPPGEFARLGLAPGDLATGVLVSTAVITRCVPASPGGYAWHLSEVHRLAHPIAPTAHPQPVWFRPFGNRSTCAIKRIG